MRPFALALGAVLICGMAIAPVRAEEPIDRPVDLALVLLTDVSQSMDDREYAMVKEGYKAAFSDPQVIQAILANSKGIAISYVEFSGKDEFIVVKGWDVLTDAASAQAFGEAVAAAIRTSSGNTALAPSIRKAADMLTAADVGGARRVIDVASDHPHDGGRAAIVRDFAVAAGITINALPIIDDRPIGTFDGHLSYATQQWGHEDPVEFYRNHVIGGPGSFLVEVRDYAAFGEALKRKLLRELISSPGSGDGSETFAFAE
ncbi:DUF1194 domain-containing protein [Dongia deserti]|uniref:DUF1194 domain-containing protein n=1 Tax=Dongia deserti TaxID=2268030 RepID=UPI000E657E7D|nr:DUF1194 domain-containing protein [Dongia deserti]